MLLFLMGVAPVLPWRKASQELLRKRLFWPAWIGAASLVLAVMVGATGWAPLVAFGMAGFAAGAALRQLALATRRQGWRGFVGRANGGMIVHLGVIMIAVALASSNSFTHATRLQLEQGVEQEWQGHTFRLESVRENVNDAGSESALEARVLLDDSKVIVPAITTYLNMGVDVPTPGVRTGLTNDVYLTLEQGAQPGDTSVSIQAFIRPMILWLWIGGLVMALGTLLSAFPGSKRRRATDPVSAPIPRGATVAAAPDGEPEPEPAEASA
jgi:cytochrome c-type biogenesis protein CcmF